MGHNIHNCKGDRNNLENYLNLISNTIHNIQGFSYETVRDTSILCGPLCLFIMTTKSL